MGVLHGRDLFSTKWITAIITDATHRLHIVPIKHNLGEYFITDIDESTYVFKIDGTRIVQYRETLTKSFRVIQYDTTHYLPYSSDLKELELVLQKNNLPKADGMLSKIFRVLSAKEKKPFIPHNLRDLAATIQDFERGSKSNAPTQVQEQYSKEAMNMLRYLDRLSIDELVTPIKRVSDFIQGDLIATDPKFLGSVVSSYQRTDLEHKKVTNTPITAKQGWMKFMLIFMGIGLVGFIGFYLYDSGMLENFGMDSMLPTFGGMSDAELMQRYPDGASLKAAVDSGEVDYNSLSPTAQKIVDETPSATPIEPEPEVIPEVVPEVEETVEEIESEPEPIEVIVENP